MIPSSSTRTTRALTSCSVAFTLLIGCVPNAAFARQAASEVADPVLHLVELGRTESRVQEHLEVLTKEIGPRLTTSRNLARAEEWCRDQLASWGLDARIESYDEWAVGFDRGPSSGRIVKPDEKALSFMTHAWTRGTEGPVRGPAVLEPSSAEELEEVQAAFHGAWLVQPPRARGERLASELRSAIRDAALEAGVLGTVRPGSQDGRLLMSGRPPADMDAIADELRITLQYEDCEDLVRRLEEGQAVELEFDVDNRFREGPIALNNVVADIVGSEFPDEFVIVQGHLDSWDGAEGACDNGTGVATTLEAARLIMRSGLKPRRTIRFVLYSGEEQGLHGSRGYVRDHADELERTSIVLNHDNGTNYLAGIRATEAMRADFERVFAPVMALDSERPFEVRAVEGIGPGPSDHAPFVRAGVPGFHWLQDGAGYRRVHHTQFDTFETAKPEDQKHSALVAALAAYGFAQLDGLVDRTFMTLPEKRKMGVYLEGTRVTRVLAGKARDAGWKIGDVVLAVDGEAVTTQTELVDALQTGEARKTVTLARGEEELETVLDYTDDPAEEERARRRAHAAKASAGSGG